MTIVLTMVLGLEAWRRYESATVQFPEMPHLGRISILVPDNAFNKPSIEVHVQQHILDKAVTTYSLEFSSPSRCASIGFVFDGAATVRNWKAVRDTTLSTQKAEFLQHPRDDPQSFEPQGLLVEACSPPGPVGGGVEYTHEIEVEVEPFTPMIVVNGHRGAVWTPIVDLLPQDRDRLSVQDLRGCLNGHCHGFEPAHPWGVTVSTFLGSDYFRIDNAAPAPDSESPADGPRWSQTFDRASTHPRNMRYNVAGVRASFVYQALEARADSDLFVSGVLAGLAGGFATWSIQAVVDALPRRRRGDQSYRGDNT